MMRVSKRIVLSALLAIVLMAFIGCIVLFLQQNPVRGLPHSYFFQSGGLDSWQPYGGTWNITSGNIENDSDERGAKIMTGSSHWKNYSIEADIELLGSEGDAGLIVRSSNEETGVDAYDGYYAGIRAQENQLSTDNSLLLAKEHYEYDQLNSTLIPGGVAPFHWYHLKLLVYGCRIVAAVTNPPGSHNTTTTSAIDPNCFKSGRIGLRSYASGGVWKNIEVRSATKADLEKMLAVPPASPPQNGKKTPTAGTITQPLASDITSIHQLRLMPFTPQQTASIRGVVIATRPQLYIQDSTGGAEVQEDHVIPLKIGDEVQATGLVYPGDFSPVLRQANVRLLWTSTPIPPVFVTSSQASTGSFDATFVEVKGRVETRTLRKDHSLVLRLRDEQQTFQAILYGGQATSIFHRLRPGSLVTVRGICVVSPTYTHNLTPFAVLLRSSGDLNILQGPPWWTPEHLVELLFMFFVFILLMQYLHARVERWRMRAVLDERERLAHEMHDTLAQSFAGIGFQLEAIRNEFPSDAKASAHLNLACDLARYSHEEARRNIASLRPEFLASQGLVTALKRCADQRLTGGHVRVIAEGRQDSLSLPPILADTLYRIGQEAIANAIRHANPQVIVISLYVRDATIEFSVKDDGIGFCETEITAGFGLGGMRKRAEMISARFNVLSHPSEGTTIVVRASLPPPLTWKTAPAYAWRAFKEFVQHGESNATSHPHSHRG